MELRPQTGELPQNWLARAVVAGVVGATALLAAFLAAYALAAVSAGIKPAGTASAQLINAWLRAATANPLVDLRQGAFYGVLAANLGLALAGALAYAALEPSWRGSGWARGLGFALPLWLVSALVILPLAGAGPFGAALRAGPLPAYGLLLAYLAYGAGLGAAYAGLAGQRDLPSGEGWSVDRPLLTGAVGTLLGVLAGALLGAGLGPLLGASGRPAPFGMSPAALAVGLALVGGALGELAGLLAGLVAAPRPGPATAGAPRAVEAELAPVLPTARFRVVAVNGACPRGYRVGDGFDCTPAGDLSPELCPAAAQALQPLVAAMLRQEPDAPRAVACPIHDHMLVLKPAGAA